MLAPSFFGGGRSLDTGVRDGLRPRWTASEMDCVVKDQVIRHALSHLTSLNQGSTEPEVRERTQLTLSCAALAHPFVPFSVRRWKTKLPKTNLLRNRPLGVLGVDVRHRVIRIRA